MNGLLTIAIDGPSGAGKSTIAKAVAERLCIDYIDRSYVQGDRL